MIYAVQRLGKTKWMALLWTNMTTDIYITQSNLRISAESFVESVLTRILKSGVRGLSNIIFLVVYQNTLITESFHFLVIPCVRTENSIEYRSSC